MKKLIVFLILCIMCFIPPNCKSQVEWSKVLQTQPYWVKCNVEEDNDTLKSFVTVETTFPCIVKNNNRIIRIKDYDGLLSSTKRLVESQVCADTNLWVNETYIDSMRSDSTFYVHDAPIWNEAIFKDSNNAIINFRFDGISDAIPMSSVVIGTPVTGYGITEGTIVLENLYDKLLFLIKLRTQFYLM